MCQPQCMADLMEDDGLQQRGGPLFIPVEIQPPGWRSLRGPHEAPGCTESCVQLTAPEPHVNIAGRRLDCEPEERGQHHLPLLEGRVDHLRDAESRAEVGRIRQIDRDGELS